MALQRNWRRAAFFGQNKKKLNPRPRFSCPVTALHGPLARFLLRRLAPEFGFALDQTETLSAKLFGVSVVEQLDKLG